MGADSGADVGLLSSLVIFTLREREEEGEGGIGGGREGGRGGGEMEGGEGGRRGEMEGDDERSRRRWEG